MKSLRLNNKTNGGALLVSILTVAVLVSVSAVTLSAVSARHRASYQACWSAYQDLDDRPGVHVHRIDGIGHAANYYPKRNVTKKPYP